MRYTYNCKLIKAKLDKGEKIITKGISFDIEGGKSLALIGQTGSGKTMTALSCMGLLPANVYAKDLQIFGASAPGKDIAYIPQSGAESLNPTRTVGKQIEDSIRPAGKYTTAELRNKTCELLKAAGLGDPEKLLGMYPFQISGGMAQRVCIAMALSCDAKLVIADEPTNGLDYESKLGFIKLLNDKFPCACKLVITHDIQLAGLCDDVLVIKDGELVEKGSSKEVLNAPKESYTKALLSALVANGMKYEEDIC